MIYCPRYNKENRLDDEISGFITVIYIMPYAITPKHVFWGLLTKSNGVVNCPITPSLHAYSPALEADYACGGG